MTNNNHRRLTAGPPDGNPIALVPAIHQDTLTAFERIEFSAGPLDTRTVLAILVRQALDDLVSYWPPQEMAYETNVAMLDLRCQLLTSLHGDATPVEVLRHAAQTIAQLRQDVAHQADVLRHAAQTIAQLRQDVAHQADVLAVTPAAADEEQDAGFVGVTVAGPAPESGAIDWDALAGPDLPPAELAALIHQLETGAVKFRTLPVTTRRMLLLHALDQLDLRYDNRLLMRQFDEARPNWLPTAAAVISFFDLGWPDMLDNVRRTRS